MGHDGNRLRWVRAFPVLCFTVKLMQQIMLLTNEGWQCTHSSGLHDTVLVVGVEAMTHTEAAITTESLATASHWPTEGGKGATFVSLNAGLMQVMS